jgi:hypothetical protein
LDFFCKIKKSFQCRKMFLSDDLKIKKLKFSFFRQISLKKLKKPNERITFSEKNIGST